MKFFIIKIRFAIALLCWSSCGYAQFLGGEANGHANIRISNVACVSTNINPFSGGEADGHANIRLSNVACVSTNINPFLGGEADGHASIRISNVVCPVINNNPFSGGEADGHANTRLSNVVCPVVNVNPFIGSEADGYSNARLTNVPDIICLHIILPVDLLAFNAQLNDDKVDLFWTTASEINNDYFTVERSKNGITFEKVVEVDGAGNSSSVLHYSTVDETPLEDISYYRLKQTDLNGQYKYSNIVSVNLHTRNVNVFPVPFAHELTIEIKGSNKPIRFEMLNALGVVVYKSSFIQKTTIKTSHIPAGVYMIKLQNEDIFKIQKVIKE
jgi:hypothetical protein